MDKQALREPPDRTLIPHNKQAKTDRAQKRFTAQERKKKEEHKRSLGGF